MKYSIYTCLILSLFFCGSSINKSRFSVRGVSFEAPNNSVDKNTFHPIAELGSNWVSLMPYAFVGRGKSTVSFNHERQWIGEREEGIIQAIESARVNNLKIMMKPHLWARGVFTGNLSFTEEEKWDDFKQTYEQYVIYYARLSEKYGVELFCMGTELKMFVKQHKLYWDELIKKIRKVYSGKLVYAANWDNFDKIPFWKELDYIGVDAYFPLSDEKTPVLDSLTRSWEKWWMMLGDLSKENAKKIIFTEIGYRSIDYTTRQQWVSYEDFGDENQQAQLLAYQAFFESAKSKPFFEGAFLWKWHESTHLPPKGNEKYTFQNKLAEKYIKSSFQ